MTTNDDDEGATLHRFGEITERYNAGGWDETGHVYSLKPETGEDNESFKARVRRWAISISKEINAATTETRYILHAGKIVRGELTLSHPASVKLTTSIDVEAMAVV